MSDLEITVCPICGKPVEGIGFCDDCYDSALDLDDVDLDFESDLDEEDEEY